MNTYERKKLKRFLLSNPLLTSDKPIARAIIYSEIHKIVNRLHKDEPKVTRVAIEGEIIGNVEILINEINADKRKQLN
jgi:hypothetical protein|tara:strand:- start:715 stop:948 length:234 start_codon:yes stop_codon:yes gene_type:complete